jgi:catechol 2,3-dioxygenase-like lactoylglutathione lyase family enzyme
MINVLRVGHATFTTPDLERQVAYYSDVLGLIVTERDKNRAFLATRTGLEVIALERGDRPELTRLSFQVAPDADFAAYARELSEHGIKSEQRNGISPGAARALVFTDIKGTIVELYSDYTFAKDDGGQTAITPLKLGHVAHRVDDVQKTVKFYTDVLGFRVSDWHGDYFAFLRCGTDHHTVNFVHNEKPQLHHIAFEVRDWSELHRAADFLARKGVHLVWGPQRHIIGHNIAAYHRDPDYIRIELYCEMDQMTNEALGYFDPRPWHQDRPQLPKTWPEGTLRSYWGFGSHGTFPGYP